MDCHMGACESEDITLIYAVAFEISTELGIQGHWRSFRCIGVHILVPIVQIEAAKTGFRQEEQLEETYAA